MPPEAETLTAVAGIGLYKQKQRMLATARSTANKECQEQLDGNNCDKRSSNVMVLVCMVAMVLVFTLLVLSQVSISGAQNMRDVSRFSLPSSAYNNNKMKTVKGTVACDTGGPTIPSYPVAELYTGI